MAKKFKAKKPQRYQAIGYRPSRNLVVVLAILISVGLVGSTLVAAVFALPNVFGGGNVRTYEAVISDYRNILKDDPDNVEVRIQLGHALFDLANKTGDELTYMEAETEYKKVLEEDPENIIVMGNLAIVNFYTGRTDNAIEYAQKVLEIDPEFHVTRMNYAIFLGDGKGDYIGAIKELEKIPNTYVQYNQVQELIKKYNSALAGR